MEAHKYTLRSSCAPTSETLCDIEELLSHSLKLEGLGKNRKLVARDSILEESVSDKHDRGMIVPDGDDDVTGWKIVPATVIHKSC